MFRRSVDPWVVVADVIALLVFAAIGRQSHNETNPIGAVIATAAPFIVGWLVVAWPSGLLVPQRISRWVITTIGANVIGCGLGLVMRSVWLQREIPLSFAVVSFFATSSLLVVARFIQYRRIAKESVV